MYAMIRSLTLAAALVLCAASPAAAATLHGKITQVDVKARTFSVASGKSVTQLTLASDVQIMKTGSTSSTSELAKGEEVTVDYKLEHGKQVASRVDIQPDAAFRTTPAAPSKPAPPHH